MSFSKQHPIAIVHRCISIEAINDLSQELGLEKIKEYNPNVIKSYNEIQEDGTEIEVLELDFEYMLFSAHQKQLDIVLEKYQKDKEEQKKSEKDTSETQEKLPQLKTFEVTYFYMAQGMDKPEEQYLGIHTGFSADSVKDEICLKAYPDKEEVRLFYRSCLTARQISK